MSIVPIDGPTGTLSDDGADLKLKGKLVVSIVDCKTQKPVWQMKAERCLDGPLAQQDKIDAEFARLFEAYPPPLDA